MKVLPATLLHLSFARWGCSASAKWYLPWLISAFFQRKGIFLVGGNWKKSIKVKWKLFHHRKKRCADMEEKLFTFFSSLPQFLNCNLKINCFDCECECICAANTFNHFLRDLKEVEKQQKIFSVLFLFMSTECLFFLGKCFARKTLLINNTHFSCDFPYHCINWLHK